MLYNIFHKASIIQALHYNHLKTFKFHNVISYLTNFSMKHLQIEYRSENCSSNPLVSFIAITWHLNSPGSLPGPGLKVRLESEENISLNALIVAPPESCSGPNVHLMNSK